MFRVLVRKHANEAIVRPAFEVVEKRRKMEIKNATKKRIIVTVPEGVFEAPKKGLREFSGVHPVAPGDVLKLVVREDAEDGLYSFPIFCEETFSYAQANSDPEFIVE